MFNSKKIAPLVLTDEQLMQDVCKGRRSAFEQLYDRYFNKLVWFAQGFTGDMQQAEDLVQDVFMKVIERPEQFDATKKFSTWIYVVTGNLCKQYIRNQKNRLRIIALTAPSLDETTFELPPGSDLALLKEKIRIGYNELNEKEKNIYTLRFEQELSIKEIAAIISIPEGSVKSGIYYLLKKLALHLKDFNHEH